MLVAMVGLVLGWWNERQFSKLTEERFGPLIKHIEEKKPDSGSFSSGYLLRWTNGDYVFITYEVENWGSDWPESQKIADKQANINE